MTPLYWIGMTNSPQRYNKNSFDNKPFLYFKRRKITTITTSCFLVFLFILAYPLRTTWPFVLTFCFKPHFPVSEPLFTRPHSFSLCIFISHLPSHALAVFPSIVPLPKSFHKPSFYQFMSELFRFGLHITCLLFVSPTLTDFVIFVPPQPQKVEKGKVGGTLQDLKFSDSSEIKIIYDDRYSLPHQSGQSWKSPFSSSTLF